MKIKALLQFGKKRQASQPPIINLVISLILFFGVVPWLLLDGKFLLKGDFRPKEVLLTVHEQPMLFYILVFFCSICGFISLYSAASGYRQNLRAIARNNSKRAISNSLSYPRGAWWPSLALRPNNVDKRTTLSSGLTGWGFLGILAQIPIEI
ncbi:MULTISPECIES: hypothetical protein [unclassified Microbulbifer]|uniref:hypothetical protein n=1 Tax=unclassified Microbulbifer TaxID=2619833 RepID=UPI0027E47F6E|nr:MULTISPECIES: hypothetical protein [unclassified Microbulbifer]